MKQKKNSVSNKSEVKQDTSKITSHGNNSHKCS